MQRVHILLIVTCVFGKRLKIQPRIIGGRSISIDESPYQAALEQPDGNYFCSGVIINHISILTAAHCLHQAHHDPSTIQVRIGSSTKSSHGQVHPVQKIIIHESYDRDMNDYDIGIVQLKKQLHFSRKIQPIPLPNGPITIGTQCTVSGWGSFNEDGSSTQNLQQAVVTVITTEECNEDYQKLGFKDLTPRMLCASGSIGLNRMDACQGDSGAGLVCDHMLYGLVSWGLGCAELGRPGIYTNITNLLDWIISPSLTLISIVAGIIVALVRQYSVTARLLGLHPSSNTEILYKKCQIQLIILIFIVALVFDIIMYYALRSHDTRLILWSLIVSTFLSFAKTIWGIDRTMNGKLLDRPMYAFALVITVIMLSSANLFFLNIIYNCYFKLQGWNTTTTTNSSKFERMLGQWLFPFPPKYKNKTTKINPVTNKPTTIDDILDETIWNNFTTNNIENATLFDWEMESVTHVNAENLNEQWLNDELDRFMNLTIFENSTHVVEEFGPTVENQRNLNSNALEDEYLQDRIYESIGNVGVQKKHVEQMKNDTVLI